jgi:hypothetical protein
MLLQALRASGNCVENALDIIDLSDSDDDTGASYSVVRRCHSKSLNLQEEHPPSSEHG